MAETEATQLPKRPSRRFAVFALLAAAALTAAALTYRASQWVPPFYQQTLVAERADLAAFGDDLERELLNLHSEINDDGHWEGVFSDEQINGWLAVDMLDKIPATVTPCDQRSARHHQRFPNAYGLSVSKRGGLRRFITRGGRQPD